MPIDRSRYPENWNAISRRIRFERALNQCECTGECGQHHEHGRCEAVNYLAHPNTGSVVVLTVAHLGVERPDGSPGDKHDKLDCRDENLKAMCQSCHLSLDLGEHLQNRYRNNRQGKAVADLFDNLEA